MICHMGPDNRLVREGRKGEANTKENGISLWCSPENNVQENRFIVFLPVLGECMQLSPRQRKMGTLYC